jgi:hypothetical protein
MVASSQAIAAGDDTTLAVPGPVSAEPPVPSRKPVVIAGVAGTVVGSLGSYEGGAAIMALVGWNTLSWLRLALTAERSVLSVESMYSCPTRGCDAGANPSYSRLAIAVEGHESAGRIVDIHAGVDIGGLLRNAWRLAVRGEVGVDLRLGSVAIGPFAGAVFAERDSVFNVHGNYALTGGARVIIEMPSLLGR